MTSAQSSQPPPNSNATDVNVELIQAVKSLSNTVKGLESEMAIFEYAVAGCAPGSTPPAFTLNFPPAFPLTSGSNDQSSVTSTSSGIKAPKQSANTSSQDVNALPSTSHYNLSTIYGVNKILACPICKLAHSLGTFLP